MNIAPSLAQKIVDELTAVLNQLINFMDTNAIIIASSEPTRINSFHGGAARVLKNQKTLFIEYDGQYEGAKKRHQYANLFQRRSYWCYRNRG